MRRGPLRPSMNGELAAAELTATTPARQAAQETRPLAQAHVGSPTRLNFASTPSNVPWPSRKTTRMSSVFS